MEGRESQKERDYRYALARAMPAIQLVTQPAREAAFRRLESDFGWPVASKAWREAQRIRRDVDAALEQLTADENGGDGS